MYKDIRIAPENERGKGQAITFVLAIGAVRQVCRLQTTFQTPGSSLELFAQTSERVRAYRSREVRPWRH